jgi:hypothetical protein
MQCVRSSTPDTLSRVLISRVLISRVLISRAYREQTAWTQRANRCGI